MLEYIFGSAIILGFLNNCVESPPIEWYSEDT